MGSTGISEETLEYVLRSKKTVTPLTEEETARLAEFRFAR
jgi:hypothetical protein